jgi:thiamine pyrophosphokinase
MRALIFANGDAAADIEHWMQPDALVIAADGGTHNALQAGVTPQIVIGDLDSLPAEMRVDLETRGVQFIAYSPRKDETDLELALRYALEKGASEIAIFSALGGRWDQALANILLLALPELQHLPAYIVDTNQTLRVVANGGEAHIKGRIGDTLSLIALGGDANGVSIRGCEYPLDNARLPFAHTLGISNVLSETQARVSVAKGIVLLIHIQSVTQEGG